MKLHRRIGQHRPKIFISYRRDDADAYTDILYERLTRHFGRKQIFVDVDNIPIGKDFVEVISAEVSNSDILLAVIGKQWLTINDGQRRRLDNPEDFVRIEIATALRSGIPVSPILVQDASMPRAEELPDELKPLARRNAFVLSRAHRHEDLDRLIKEVERVLAATPGQPAATNKVPFVKYGLLVISLAVLALVIVYVGSSRKTESTINAGSSSPTPSVVTSTPELTLNSAVTPTPFLKPSSSPRPSTSSSDLHTPLPANSKSRSENQQATPTPRSTATRTPGQPLDQLQGTITLDIDPTTGLLAVQSCPVIRTRTFMIGTEPKKYCGPEYHRKPDKD